MADQYNQAERRAIYEDRELLLDYLNSVYPLGLTERDILDTMLDLPRPVEGHKVRRDLAILADLGLTQREKRKHPITKKPSLYWKLTAKGVRFCEANKPWESFEK